MLRGAGRTEGLPLLSGRQGTGYGKSDPHVMERLKRLREKSGARPHSVKPVVKTTFYRSAKSAAPAQIGLLTQPVKELFHPRSHLFRQLVKPDIASLAGWHTPEVRQDLFGLEAAFAQMADAKRVVTLG
jgi:hypothetical protein